MKTVSRRGFLRRTLAGAAAASSPGRTATISEVSCDVAIYGATPAGIASAVAAARLGRNVILLAHEDHIGGIVSNGLTNADIGKRQAVGGLFYEFTRRVVRYYEDFDRNNPEKPNVKLCRDGYWYEASAAEKIFHDMIAGEGRRIRLMLQHQLERANVERGRLASAEFADTSRPGQTVKVNASVFIDTTYEGDLAAAAGAPFRTGRESRAEYGEKYAGRIYMRFGETEPLPGSTGEADNATQAFCFRFHVTNDPQRRIPIERPKDYRREDYHFVLEDIRAGRAKRFRDIIQVYPMPNGKFELNSDHVHPDTMVPSESLDLAEENWEWPTATVERRRAIYQRYLSHNIGLIWLLQNDPEVPESLREDARQYGWPRDEWPSNGHVPRQVYVRQGRRILGDYILTERDGDVNLQLQRTRVQRTSIGIVEWPFDPHAHHKYDPAHPGVREGYFFVKHEPFQVPYNVLTPKKVDGLLVPVACSCSHVAYNALRMEPVFMALGEAAGIAAHLAIDEKVPVRKVAVPKLQKVLVERRGVINFLEDLPFDHPSFAALQWLGARGWNLGYKADPNRTLTTGEAWDRLSRVLQAERRKTPAQPADRDAPLTAAEAAAWLRQAGYPAPQAARPEEILNNAQFAGLAYGTMTAALRS
ncbi:MAG: FAD-dependent oxidoreductase [Bryobacteraceae bacterium]|jgi:Heterodisulfide reductase, subunit A and related polyferredoxins|nr:FAD-dependent oxidoreductase [Bryobacteraceae bacterium]